MYTLKITPKESHRNTHMSSYLCILEQTCTADETHTYCENTAGQEVNIKVYYWTVEEKH